MEKTRTELHTHLVGMLSFDNLLNMLKELDYPGFPINDNNELDFENAADAKRTWNIAPEIVKGLMIPRGESVDYQQLNPIYFNRNSLLADASCFIDSKTNSALNIVYSKYFNLALGELIEQGVEYVEISFSNLSRIKYMLENINPDIENKINVRFLLATDRIRSVNAMKDDRKILNKGLNNDLAIGFDFMGLEREFNNNENDSNKFPSYSINSFRSKLHMVIDILKDFPKSVLRIHAGENKESQNNPLSTLRMIDAVAEDKGIVIPPPEIRLGHAIYFQDCEEYLELLRKYEVIVEINASSNMALSNIETCKEINYEYYVSNDIPVVVSTDGSGIYDTTIEKEDDVVINVAGGKIFKKIIKHDEKIINNKRS